MPQLNLIGTLHEDPKGPERLMKFLSIHNPTYVCIEATREEAQKILRDRGKKVNEDEVARVRAQYGGDGLEKIMRFLDLMGYEVWVPHQYKRKNPKLQIRYLDIDIESDITNRAIDSARGTFEDFCREKAVLNLEEYQRLVDKGYNNLRQDEVVDGESSEQMKSSLTAKKIFEETIVKRDDAVEANLKRIFGLAKPSDVIDYVSGDRHIFGSDIYRVFGFKNLFERLFDLRPGRFKLVEADAL